MSLTITSINVNGIRAATKQRSADNLGLLEWLRSTEAGVVLLQEVRATEAQSREVLAPALADGWEFVAAPAAAKGRAGVAILSRLPLSDVTIGFGSFGDAGRWIEATVAADFGPVRVASLYLPSGSAGTEKQDEKYRFFDEFERVLWERADHWENMVIGGDWNICHRREDLKNWKTNQKKSGFLPEERRFMDAVFGVFPDSGSQIAEPAGEYRGAVNYSGGPLREATTQPRWFDVARRLHPEQSGPYTWWTYRGQAFNSDAGWRIDYQAATAAMLARARNTWVDKAAEVELRWSDHAPLNVRYE